MSSYTEAHSLYIEAMKMKKEEKFKEAFKLILKSSTSYVELLKKDQHSERKEKMTKLANKVLSEAEDIKKVVRVINALKKLD